ncbi:cytochrome P450 [Xylaria bambusicola]|uniref:cytochrome P450 n=1 Tax=Xylaria bambusicola TaxID=326684 RepID=UPI0020088544|nr:cytochrome P450 [Xylaria bambusicola]KAI0512526.1 cytochrome P450 [Xylaria bambusicola]
MQTHSGIILTSVISALLTAFVSYVAYQCLLSPLASFPGPFPAKINKLWRAYATYRGRWHSDIVRLHQRYGPVVRIGPNELSIGDPEAFLQIYRISGPFSKSASYSVVQGSRPFDLAGERNEKVHAAQRRLVARPYSMESTLRLEPQIDELVRILLGKLDAVATSSTQQVIDLGHWLQLFAFDAIGTVSFTKPYGFLASGSDNGMFPRLEQTMHSASWLMHASWFFRLHQKAMPWLGNWLAVNDRNGYFFQFAQREVQARKDQGGSDLDIVGQLFQAQQAKAELNDLSISYMMTSNVFAGSDTTSIALRAIFLSLIRHPHVLEKLRSELKDNLNNFPGKIVNAAEADSCQYLQAVIYEGLRVFSPAGFMLDRDVPAEGMVIGGRRVPGGTVVGTSPWVIHRCVEVWGGDAEEFRPERWIEAENPGHLKRFFFAFGGGTRTCIGRNISWLEIEKLVSTLVMRYDFELASDAMISEYCGALVFLKDLRVTVCRREA